MKIQRLITACQNAPNHDRDRLILMTGPERTGKSSDAYKLGEAIDPTFGPERMCFSAEEFMRKAETLPPGSVLVLDESTRGAFSRDAMTGKNKDFVKWLVVCGARNLVLIILFPNIRWLDRYITEHRAHYWILKTGRGAGIVHKVRRGEYPGAKTGYPRWFGYENMPPAQGPGWDAYLQAKDDAVSEAAQSADDPWQPPKEQIAALAQRFKAALAA